MGWSVVSVDMETELTSKFKGVNKRDIFCYTSIQVSHEELPKAGIKLSRSLKENSSSSRNEEFSPKSIESRAQQLSRAGVKPRLRLRHAVRPNRVRRGLGVRVGRGRGVGRSAAGGGAGCGGGAPRPRPRPAGPGVPDELGEALTLDAAEVRHRALGQEL